MQTPDDEDAQKPLALIAGPTASGKSDLAITLAIKLREAGKKAVIVNADSAQVYRDLQILSARPQTADIHGVDHALFGEWDGAIACSAPQWAQAAKDVLTSCWTSGAIPILVGGTGLYIRTLLDGIAPLPPIAQSVRDAVRAMPVAEAYRALQGEDPERAAKLAPADAQRIARALEVVRATGRTLAHWQQQREGGIADHARLAAFVLVPDRRQLYARCDARFVAMMNGGAIAEVERLLARQLAPDLPVMRAIGVPQISAMLAGEISQDTAIARAQQATRNYAKRQCTWLRHQMPSHWHRILPDNINIEHQFDILFH